MGKRKNYLGYEHDKKFGIISTFSGKGSKNIKKYSINYLYSIVLNRERYKEEDFKSFVEELLNRKRFNDSKEEGIAKLVIDKGFEALSEKQKFVFENSISYHIYNEYARLLCFDST